MMVLKPLLGLFFYLLASVSYSNLLAYKHERLDVQRAEYLSGEQPLLLFFFELQCSWCIKQTPLLNSLAKSCQSDITVVGMGVNGDRHVLKKTFWRTRAEFESFAANADFLKQMGQIPATPLLVLLNTEGQLIKAALGFHTQQRLSDFLFSSLSISC